MRSNAIEILNPIAFQMDEIVDLLREGLGFDRRMDVDGAMELLRELVMDTKFGILLARNKEGAFAGFAIISAHLGPFFPVPQVLHFHAPKNTDVKLALAKKLKEWIEERGISTMWSINLTGLEDKDYAGRFGMIFEIGPVGSIMEFNIAEERAE